MLSQHAWVKETPNIGEFRKRVLKDALLALWTKQESGEPDKDGAHHLVDALRYLVTNLDRPGAQ